MSQFKHTETTSNACVLFFFFSLVCLLGMNLIIGACGGGGGDDNDNPTPTPTAQPTPTPTPFSGWRTERQVAGYAEWIDLGSNSKGEICLSYSTGNYLGFVLRDAANNWTGEGIVPLSENRIEVENNTQTSIDENGDLHFVWSGPYPNDDGERSVYYNRWQAETRTWFDQWNYRNLLVFGGESQSTWAPNFVSNKTQLYRFVAATGSYSYYNGHRSVSFNYDVGNGWALYSGPLYDDNSGEEKYPVLAIADSGTVFLAMCHYLWYNDQPQIAINEFDPSNHGWRGWVVPAISPEGISPSWPAMAVGHDGSIHLVWYNTSGGGVYDELVYCMRDLTGTWRTAQSIFSGDLMHDSLRPTYPRIAVNSDGVVMVVFSIRNDAEKRIYYALKHPEQNWTIPALVTTATNKQNFPALTTYGRFFSLAWANSGGGIFYNEFVP
jgi:hypothetical protein